MSDQLERAWVSLLRAEIASLYETIAPDEVLVFSGAEEAIFIAANVLLGRYRSGKVVLGAMRLEPPEGISFLKEQQWKILAGTDEARKRKLVEQLRLPAMVAARPPFFRRG